MTFDTLSVYEVNDPKSIDPSDPDYSGTNYMEWYWNIRPRTPRQIKKATERQQING